jgi:hypothetical protein
MATHTTGAFPDLQTMARLLGGEVSGGQVLCPGPGHSAKDKSLSVKIDSGAPDGFVVHSFSTDDPIACRDYVREKLGLSAFKPDGRYRRASDDAVQRALMAAINQSRDNKPKGNIVATYPYTDANGTLLYQVLRYEPKDFRQRQPDGNGGWIWKLEERRVLYRWPEVLKYPDASIFVTEGEKDADRVADLQLCATTVAAGKWTVECVQALAGRDVIILADNDAAGRKKALEAATALHGVANSIRIVLLPDLPERGDVSNWLDADPRRDAKALAEACFAVPEWSPDQGANAASENAKAETQPAKPCTLAEAHAAFRHWLGDEFDIDTLNAVLAVAAAEKLPGDPAWLLIISGPGNAKTETVQATGGLGAHVVSTLTSEAALLSATPSKQRAKTATGGLLRKIGERGILAIKDVTSILSMDRNVRASVLAALREIHDGHWVRNVGSDGGQTLIWKGRLVVLGACTTAWDQAHTVIATMGDRFVLIRSDSHKGRITGGLRAMRNTGAEVTMRAELAAAVAGVVNGIDTKTAYVLTENDENTIVEAANIVTLARTGVETDYRGDVIDAHAPEMPTRFAKQLTQIMRGAIAIGMSRLEALQLVTRCARDSMPRLRLDVLRDVAANDDTRVLDVRRRLQKPRATVDRALQSLHFLGLLTCREEEMARGDKLPIYLRHYSLAADISLAVLDDPNTH